MGRVSPPQTPAPRRGPLPFEVVVRPDRSRVIVSPAGEIDLATVDQVQESIEQAVAAGFAKIVLDLRNVEFLDSTGLRLILEHVQREDTDFAVAEGPAGVQRVFEVAGVLDRIPFVDLSQQSHGRNGVPPADPQES